MLNIVFGFVIVGICKSIVFPVELEVLTDEIRFSTRLEQNIATLYIKNTLGGFLALGFGINMTNADIFILEITKGKLTLRNCLLVGFKGPLCSATGNYTLSESEIMPDGSWDAIVTRDISIFLGVTIRSGENYVIYNYSPSLLLEDGHNGEDNIQSIRKWNLAAGVAGSQISRVLWMSVALLIGLLF